MERTEVLILGGGLVGLSTAIGLAKNDIAVTVVDPADPLSPPAGDAADNRVTAIASASWKMFEALGIAGALRPHANPIDHIEVRDGPQPTPLTFTPDDGEPLGWMVENWRLRVALAEAARDLAGLTVLPRTTADVTRAQDGVTAALSDGRTLTAQLVLACEGRASPSRQTFRAAQWQYDHHAIVAVIDHSRPHGNVAHEIFYSDGPFALLPMAPGTRSALVWSVPRAHAAGAMKLSDRAILAELNRLSAGVVGDIIAITPRQGWPLAFHHTATMIDTRLALVGDSAHGIHPIAGQGLNLGLRDVAAIVEVLVEGSRLGLDLGDAQLLTRYQRWRGFDALAVASATDIFTRLFGVPGRVPRAVRRYGLSAVARLNPLKGFFMAEARGTTGALPRLLRGEPV